MRWLAKLIKFGIVGFSGLCIDFGITYLFKEKLKLNKYLANTCGFSIAVVNNFLLNKFWTFNNSNTAWRLQLIKFVLFAIVGLAINNVLLYLFHEKWNIKFYQAKAASIVCVFFWNFFTNLLYNFH
jgi:putative flippase GtrA